MSAFQSGSSEHCSSQINYLTLGPSLDIRLPGGLDMLLGHLKPIFDKMMLSNGLNYLRHCLQIEINFGSYDTEQIMLMRYKQAKCTHEKVSQHGSKTESPNLTN